MSDHDDPIMLPPAEERDALLKMLKSVISTVGFSPLVAFPLIEPTSDFFPDPWKGGVPSFARLARRMLHYAHIDDYSVEVVIVESDPRRREAQGKSAPKARAPESFEGGVWLDRVDKSQRLCRIAVHRDELRHPMRLVAPLSRVVATAFRQIKGLQLKAGNLDQQFTDLLTVFLGFGLLSADGAHRHLSEADGFRSKGKVHRMGTLSPRSLCFLLAIQLLIRDDEPKQRQRWIKKQQVNQVAFIKESMAWVRKFVGSEPDAIRKALGIPNPETWSPSVDLEEWAAGDESLEEDDSDEEAEGVDKGIRDLNRGKPVFRVARDMSKRLSGALGLGVVMLGGVAGRSVPGLEVGMGTVVPVAAGVFVLGWLVGKVFKESRCSEPKCGVNLAEDAVECSLCGGTVSGVLSNPKERLAAEDALLNPDEEASVEGRTDG